MEPKRHSSVLPGVSIAFIIACISFLLGKLLPIIGGPIIGIVIGIGLSLFIKKDRLAHGLKFCSKRLLQGSIILIGFEMNLWVVLELGLDSLICLFVTMAVALGTAYIAGKLLKADKNTNILVGVGTAICGGSAIAATAPVIKAKDEEIASAISTIFLFNIIAVFLFPFLGRAMGLSDIGFGVWAGTAINDTSSVVAASFSYSDQAGAIATLVKLTRTLMIVPVVLALSFIESKGSERVNIAKVFPWFVLGFIFTALIRTWGVMPQAFYDSMVEIGKFMIIMAMAAIGLNANVGELLTNGKVSIALGLICWVAVAVSSLVVQYFLGMLY